MYQRSNFETMENIQDDAAWLEVGFATDPGKSGKPNQDYYGIVETVYTLDQQTKAETPIVVGVVVDGISSSSSSAIAGQMVVETIRRVLVENPGIPIKPRLDAAIRRANKEVFQATQEVAEYAGTGATLVAAACAADQLYIAHLGDSRAYLVRNRQLHLLTVDHRWGQEAVDAGEMTPEAAMAHPDRNLITRLIGTSSQIEVDHHIVDIEKSSLDLNKFQRWPLVDRMWMQPGDIILLCSDGLSDVLSAQQIEGVVNRHPPQVAAQRLVEMVNSSGGPDNVTVLLFKLPAAKAHSPEWEMPEVASKKSVQAPNYFLRTITILLLVAGLISGIWLVLNRIPLPFQLSLPSIPIFSQQNNQTENDAVPVAGSEPGAESGNGASQATITDTAVPASAAVQITATAGISDALTAGTPVTATSEITDELVSETPITTTVEITSELATGTPVTATVDFTEALAAETSLTNTAEASIEAPLAEHTISIIQPDEGAILAGIQQFEWEDNADLAENEIYEMLIWSETEEISEAKSVAGVSKESQRVVNLNSVGLAPGNYQWSVRILNLEDGSEVTSLGDPATFTYAP